MSAWVWIIAVAVLLFVGGLAWMLWEIRHAPLCDRDGNPIPEVEPEVEQ